MGRHQRTKGARWELKTTHDAEDRGIVAEHLIGQARNGGADVRLVLHGPHYMIRFVDIECKVGKRPNLRAAFAQAQAAEKESGNPTFVRVHFDRAETFWLIPDEYVWEYLESLKP